MSLFSIIRVLIIFSITLVPSFVFAGEGIGGLAENLLEPIAIISDFINSAAIILGASALMAAILKYKQYRKNPHASPLGKIIWLFIIGVVLVFLPLVYKLTESGIPYQFF
jgi:hypothetical protein